MGPVGQKLLILLQAGLVLSLTARPDISFKIIKSAEKEWNKINERSLRDNIRKLYESKLIESQENKDGTVTLVLNNQGKNKALRYNLDTITVKKPKQWDGIWRIVMFDIPENKKRGRDTLVEKLHTLHFYPIQKSVFAYPYECKDEIDFIVEIFELAPYVRFIRTNDIDIALHLKNKFKLT